MQFKGDNTTTLSKEAVLGMLRQSVLSVFGPDVRITNLKLDYADRLEISFTTDPEPVPEPAEPEAPIEERCIADRAPVLAEDDGPF